METKEPKTWDFPKRPAKEDRVDCILKLNGDRNHFWVNAETTPNSIKGCLYDMNDIDPLTTTLRLGGKKLIKEKPLISYYGLKNGDIISVRYVEINRLIIQEQKKQLGIKREALPKKFFSTECAICFDPSESEVPKWSAFIPCGHVCVCNTCIKKINSCPICTRLDE